MYSNYQNSQEMNENLSLRGWSFADSAVLRDEYLHETIKLGLETP